MRTSIKTTAALLMTAAIVGSCTNDSIITEINQERTNIQSVIDFTNYVGNTTTTRASKKSSNANQESFTVGESMAVWGIQFTGGDTDTIFRNQKVDYQGNNEWSYENKKYWNVGSTYMFYGVFPYSKTLYTMSEREKGWSITLQRS